MNDAPKGMPEWMCRPPMTGPRNMLRRRACLSGVPSEGHRFAAQASTPASASGVQRGSRMNFPRANGGVLSANQSNAAFSAAANSSWEKRNVRWSSCICRQFQKK